MGVAVRVEERDWVMWYVTKGVVDDGGGGGPGLEDFLVKRPIFLGVGLVLGKSQFGL